MHKLLIEQYESVRGSRQALFNYCSRMSNADIFRKVDTFNGSSIAGLLVHVANCYLSWLVNFDEGKTGSEFDGGQARGIDDISAIYKQVDIIVNDFLLKYKEGYDESFTKQKPGKSILVTTTPLQLYTHTITHEFHHKGQILSISRQLGYIPEDTDVIRY